MLLQWSGPPTRTSRQASEKSWTLEANFGEVLDAFKALAHKPGSVEPVWKLHKILMFEGELDPLIRELAVLKISSLNEAGY